MDYTTVTDEDFTAILARCSNDRQRQNLKEAIQDQIDTAGDRKGLDDKTRSMHVARLKQLISRIKLAA